VKALIMAGGADEKWTALGGGGRRHFQLVRGERVLDRIVRQLRARGVTDIGIICPPGDPDYDVPGTYRVAPAYEAWGHEGLNGQDQWAPDGRTLQVYGDTIFTDAAMDLVVGFDRRTFQMFGRFGNGVIKGGGGELFAFSLWPDDRARWVAAVQASFALRATGVIRRGGSWEGYRYMAGARGRAVGAHRRYPRWFTNIRDGMTDDFDTPAQLVKLRALFELAEA
jgi:hypothetical protein